MKTPAFTYWQDGDAWLGYLDEFPDYLTQGKSLEDLKTHLFDLHRELTSPEMQREAHPALAKRRARDTGLIKQLGGVDAYLRRVCGNDDDVR